MPHKLFYNTDYNACDYSFDTTRKSSEIVDSLDDDGAVQIVSPREWTFTTERLVRTVHSKEYVEAVKTGSPLGLAESQGFIWDADIYTMAIAHNAGVVAAVDNALVAGDRFTGTLSSGLHHAKREEGEGFCTFNGLSVASQHALNHGAERVLILDFDAHFGGGTRSTTDAEKVIQVDVSTNYFDFYKVANDFDYIWCAGVHDYIKEIERALKHATSLGQFDLVLYNAGMDPANQGIEYEVLSERERLVREWAETTNFPLAYTMAGGYLGADLDIDELVALHRLTIDTFAAA
jgi:acetoin utilization deacetylase AcuC-like enzyme